MHTQRKHVFNGAVTVEPAGLVMNQCANVKTSGGLSGHVSRR